MSDELQNVDLSLDPLDVGDVGDSGLLQDLDSDLLSSQDVGADLHLTKGALSDSLSDDVMPD